MEKTKPVWPGFGEGEANYFIKKMYLFLKN